MLDDEKLVGADRVLALLIELAGHPDGATLEDLAAAMGGSKSTIHRALGALVRSGLADQSGRGRYVLGDEFVRLAFRHHASRPTSARIEPVLRELSAHFGETAHYGVLDGHDIVYRAKTDPEVGAVRLTSTVGGRNLAATTAIGKVLLAQRLTTRADVVQWLDGETIEQRTPHSISDVDAFVEELRLTRERGYGVDDQENELGVNCIAVPVYLDGGPQASGAVSISGLAFRCPLDRLVAALAEIESILADRLGELAMRRIVSRHEGFQQPSTG
jgi:IclR family acetate operon transcriptional repressor